MDVFWVEPSNFDNQVQIAFVTILTIIAFAFAVSANLPRVPYLTFIDAFFLTCYLFVFFAVIGLMTVHVTYWRGAADVGLRIRRTVRWLVPVAFIVTDLIVAWHFDLA